MFGRTVFVRWHMMGPVAATAGGETPRLLSHNYPPQIPNFWENLGIKAEAENSASASAAAGPRGQAVEVAAFRPVGPSASRPYVRPYDYTQSTI